MIFRRIYRDKSSFRFGSSSPLERNGCRRWTPADEDRSHLTPLIILRPRCLAHCIDSRLRVSSRSSWDTGRRANRFSRVAVVITTLADDRHAIIRVGRHGGAKTSTPAHFCCLESISTARRRNCGGRNYSQPDGGRHHRWQNAL